MSNVAMLAQQGIKQPQSVQERDPLAGVSPTIRKLFIMLHGSYGNAFVSKFSTGEKLTVADKTHDKGVLAAMKVWQGKLSKYPEDVIEVAADRVGAAHPEFPPSLPQFERLCDAAMPRKTYSQEHGLPALPAPKSEPIKVDLQAQNDGKDWARRILARIKNGDTTVGRYASESAEVALGLRGHMSS